MHRISQGEVDTKLPTDFRNVFGSLRSFHYEFDIVDDYICQTITQIKHRNNSKVCMKNTFVFQNNIPRRISRVEAEKLH